MFFRTVSDYSAVFILVAHRTRFNTIGKRGRQRLFPLRRLKSFGMGPPIFKKLHSCTIENILTGYFTAWYDNCLASDHKALQRVVCTILTHHWGRVPCHPGPLYHAASEEGSKNGQRLQSPKSYTVLSATTQQAVPMHNMWNQQVLEQLLSPSHKTAK